MRKIILIQFILLFFGNISIAEIPYYTISTTTVGPGVVHKKIIAPSVPWNINVLEIDLTNQFIEMESAKAQDLMKGYEKTSSMAQRKSSVGHTVVGAVNGDFYASGGIPINTQIINGQMLKNTNGYPYIAFDKNNRPEISASSFNAKLITNTGSNTIHDINAARGTDQLVLYNSFMGSSTSANEFGTEYRIRALSGWIVNDTIKCYVSEIDTDGNMSINEGDGILSGHGLSETFLLNNVQVGDTVKLYLGLQPALTKLMQLIGGNSKIVTNGVYSGSSNADIHPRTAAGFSADSTKLFLVTVDGRQAKISRGMSYRELADFMISIGVSHAINLDGGGSTTMVVRDEVENYPSDNANEWGIGGDERNVANSLLSISTAPLTDTLYTIQVEPDNMRIYKGETIRFKLSGWDRYYSPIALNEEEVKFDADSSIGAITNDGLLTSVDHNDSGWVYVSYDDFTDSAYVYIKSVKRIDLTPDESTTDTIQTIKLNIKAFDEDETERQVGDAEYQWTSLNPQVGVVDSVGLFKGLSEGIVKIIAEYESLTDTATVTVDLNMIRRIEISPKTSVTDTTYPVKYQMKAFDKDNKVYSFPLTDYNWKCIDTYIGDVDSAGIFRGKNSGTARVVVSYINTTDTAYVNLEIGQGTSIIDAMNELDNWSFSGEDIDSVNSSIAVVDSPSTDRMGSIKMEYKFVRQRNRSWAYLNAVLPVMYGIPDSVLLDFMSNGENHEIYFELIDQNGEVFLGYTGKKAELADEYETLKTALTDFEPETPYAPITYPVRLSSVHIKIGYYGSVGDTNSGSVYLDNLRIVYPNVTSIFPLSKSRIPAAIKLRQNYPNPFNPETTICFDIPGNEFVTLSIYNVLGEKVATLLKRFLNYGSHKVSWNAKGFASGIYIFELKFAGQSLRKKMVLIK